MKNNIIILLALLFVLNSCYKKEYITAELSKPLHEFNDSSNPLDHSIYEYYSKTGVGILYKYIERDYNWNLTNVINTRLNVKQQLNEAYLLDGVKYIKKVFSNYYSEDFQKKYFPLYLLLAEDISKDSKKNQFFCGRNYILFGEINENCVNLSLKEINNRRGIVNGLYWANYIYANDMMTFPNEFFEVSKDQYEVILGEASKVDTKKYGFWDGDPSFAYHPSRLKGPTKVVDIEQFFTRICSYTKAEMELSMKGYELLKVKYDILVSYFKRVYDIDIQEIGNQQSK